MKLGRSILAIAAVFMVVGLVLGLVISSKLGIESNGHADDAPMAVKSAGGPSEQSVNVLAEYSRALVDVVSTVTPSVVNISTSRTVVRRGAGPGGPGGPFNDPFLRRFFGDEFFRQFQEPREEQSNSLGSGVIVDGGYIITNNHVIKDADKITVTLSDKREFEGKVIGTDPKTDIAVIKIETNGLPSIKWGDSDTLRVGEVVIAVGSPYGLNQTVTTGIVSAKGRANVRIADYEDFIQTDAAINPGNSGGPLVNIKGELVGINTAIFSTSGGYQGIGFSIPSNMVHVIMESLIKYKKVVRGWLGVSIQSIDKELAKQFDLKEEAGALVSDVAADSPADKAGLKRGDIIIEYDGKKVADSLTLRNMVAATVPDTKVDVIVIREGKRKTIGVKIGELPSDAVASAGEYNNALSGIAVQDLTPEIRKKLNINKRVTGVIVTDAPEGTSLKRGDVILEVNRQPVEDAEGYDQLASQIGAGEDVLLLIYRDGGIFFMTLGGE